MKKKYVRVECYPVKCRAYPTKEQREKIDKILYGLRVAYNVTAYEISQGNELVTRPDKKDESVRWPDFSKCMKKGWIDYLRENYPCVNEVPFKSIGGLYGIFKKDMEKAWENYRPYTQVQAKDRDGKPRFNASGKPVYEKSTKPSKLPCGKWKPNYYGKNRPRTSFFVTTCVSGFAFDDNSKAVRIGVTLLGKIKVRGWRHDLRFGDDAPDMSFDEYYKDNRGKAFGVTVEKDNCGDYWLIVQLQNVFLPVKESDNKSEVGIDVGFKDLAITSNGDKYANNNFKRAEKKHVAALNKQLSRRQGWANIKFRESGCKEVSKRYSATALKLAKLQRKIARRRSDYNNVVTADIVGKASFIGIENLDVKSMMQNRDIAFMASDAALYDVLQKLKYKAEWRNIDVVQIGRYEPSSQLCSVCGYRNIDIKDVKIRQWTCPKCNTKHDRDINAARNILNMAKAKVT